MCPAHLLGGIRSLLQTLRTWLPNLPSKSDNMADGENKNERDPCPSAIPEPHKLVRDLNKEVNCFYNNTQNRSPYYLFQNT